MRSRIKCAIQSGIEILTGHNIRHINSFDGFVQFMYTPVDGASLAVGRMLFGLMMLIDIPEERGGSILDIRFGRTANCFFPLLPFVKPMSASKMGIIYAGLWLGALGITIGYKFRLSSAMFVTAYWYIFLLDKSVWNNHSYLYGLCGILFLVSSSHKNFSIDALQSEMGDRDVPFWNYAVIKFQFCILYTVAGLKKLSSEWLSGYAMMNLSYHWVFWPLRVLLGEQMTDLLIIHWFVCFFDMSIVFWIIYKPTRRGATILCAMFHLMNSRLFSIGMFPWLCLVELPIFYARDWPKMLFKSLGKSETKSVAAEQSSFHQQPQSLTITIKEKLVVFLMLVYCSSQVFLPYSHFITRGYNGWIDGVYGYSWDMMIHAWDTPLTIVEIVDHNRNDHHFLHPNSFSVNDRWTKHPDMAYQYAHCIQRNLIAGQTKIDARNLSIYFDAWSSLNGRYYQRMFDPTVDMLKVQWSPFQIVRWMKPLLQQFTSKRTEMQAITKDVLGWNNFSDVMFVADFPDQTMESFISSDLDNVTLTVLDGTMVYQSQRPDTVQYLQKGQSVHVKRGEFHRVTTSSETPSCIMYTYVNRTMEKTGHGKEESSKSMLPIWKELTKRAENMRQFYLNVQNSLLFEVYGIAIPERQNWLY